MSALMLYYLSTYLQNQLLCHLLSFIIVSWPFIFACCYCQVFSVKFLGHISYFFLMHSLLNWDWFMRSYKSSHLYEWSSLPDLCFKTNKILGKMHTGEIHSLKRENLIDRIIQCSVHWVSWKMFHAMHLIKSVSLVCILPYFNPKW